MDIDMDINMDVDNDHDENEEIFKIETMEPGINAKTEEEMVKAIDAWCQKNFIPLTKVRRKAPGTNTKGDRVRGQRGYKCAHGVERRQPLRPFGQGRLQAGLAGHCPTEDWQTAAQTKLC